MTLEDIIQNMISRLGQSQRDREARELGARFVDVDERAPLDLLKIARQMARHVNYYRGTVGSPNDTWEPFFRSIQRDREAAKVLDASDGNVPPHLALLVAFLKLHEHPRGAINRITERDLEFYLRRVLRFEPRAPVPDRAHLLVELKKNVAPVILLPTHEVSAGKDARKVEQIYRPVRETLIGPWKVDKLHTVFVDPNDGGRVRCASVANSSDGRGAKLTPEAPSWPSLGDESLPFGDVGFAISSSLLRMKEGERRIEVSITLTSGGLSSLRGADVVASFQAHLTGEKGWFQPAATTGGANGDSFYFTVVIPATEGAIVDHAPAVHGLGFTVAEPVLRFRVKPGAVVGYARLSGMIVRSVHVEVSASGIKSLTLANDFGTLDPRKVFLPFGPQPTPGSRLMIGYTEALSKPLSNLTVRVRWKDKPTDFAQHYANYDVRGMGAGYFRASIAYRHPYGSVSSEPFALFEEGASSDRELPPRPSHSTAPERAEVRDGFVTLTLGSSFHHETHRDKTMYNLVTYARSGGTLTLLKEPYTPAIESLSLSYTAAYDEVVLPAEGDAPTEGAPIRVHQVDCFGQRPITTQAALLPLHAQGELLIGVAGLNAGDAVTILLQVAEGSADPNLDRWPTVSWFVLRDNIWRELGGDALVLDTTRQLRTSGVVTVVVPRDVTTESTLLPTGRVWFKASVTQGATGVSRLLEVQANAVEVRFVDRGNAPSHFETPLPQGTVTRLKTPVAAVKSLAQPYATFGGKPAESDAALSTRASERLRHKGRCINPWDYERVVLDAFPSIHKVKCVPHARDDRWLAPGNVLVVVVPDLRNTNARDTLRPTVDAGTLAQVRELLVSKVGMQVGIQVRNPTYQEVRLDFKVRFKTGFAFNAYRSKLHQELVEFLSPWAFHAERELSFGGRVYRSVLLDFVEEREYVDFVTDFRMYTSVSATGSAQDVAEAFAERPDAILVSSRSHVITEVTP